MRVNGNIALIENQLLHDAIWGDRKCIHNKEPNFTGYVNANADKVGRAFIEYCIARTLGIFRLPQCGYDNYLNGKCFYYALDEKMVLDACDELKKIISHVQNQLTKEGVAQNGKVTVVRCLSPFQVPVVAEQLRNKCITEIEFPVSIFSSYSYDGNIDQTYPAGGREDYERHINIREEVNVEDIILWDKYVGDGLDPCPYIKSMFDDEKELWVVDRSITGIKKLPVSCFHYTDGLPRDGKKHFRSEEFGWDIAVHSGTYQKRPCEREDLITKFCINRNIKKIQEESKI